MKEGLENNEGGKEGISPPPLFLPLFPPFSLSFLHAQMKCISPPSQAAPDPRLGRERGKGEREREGKGGKTIVGGGVPSFNHLYPPLCGNSGMGLW